MPYGIYIKVVSTGTHASSLLLNDIYPTTDGHTAYRRAGPVYVPVGGEIVLTYTGEVAASHESGTLRGFVDQGYITTLVFGGTEVVPFVPTGSIQMYAAASAPLGYLLCNGGAVSRSTFATLFAIIGTTYGVGDGATTFNVPDLRGRAPIGAGAGAGLTPHALAATGGAETVTLDSTMMPSHTHTNNAPGGQGNLGLVLADGTNTATAVDPSAGELKVWDLPHALTIGNTGGGLPHANMQPWLALNFIIKT
jgi:hypothetical protein